MYHLQCQHPWHAICHRHRRDRRHHRRQIKDRHEQHRRIQRSLVCAGFYARLPSSSSCPPSCHQHSLRRHHDTRCSIIVVSGLHLLAVAASENQQLSLAPMQPTNRQQFNVGTERNTAQCPQCQQARGRCHNTNPRRQVATRTRIRPPTVAGCFRKGSAASVLAWLAFVFVYVFGQIQSTT